MIPGNKQISTLKSFQQIEVIQLDSTTHITYWDQHRFISEWPHTDVIYSMQTTQAGCESQFQINASSSSVPFLKVPTNSLEIKLTGAAQKYIRTAQPSRHVTHWGVITQHNKHRPDIPSQTAYCSLSRDIVKQNSSSRLLLLWLSAALTVPTPILTQAVKQCHTY